jgi:hypothetical protein
MKFEEALKLWYLRTLVQQIILGPTDPLNQQLIKLRGVQFPPERRRHFQREVRTLARRDPAFANQAAEPNRFVQILLRSAVRLPVRRVEIQNMRTMMDLIREEYGLAPIKSPEELVEWLQQFHTRLADRLHHGQAVLDLVPD